MSYQKVALCSSSSSSNASVTATTSSVATNIIASTPSNLDALTIARDITTDFTNGSSSLDDDSGDHSIADDFYLLYENQNDKRKRQKLMSEKLEALQNLLPDPRQKDHEALLDDAANYIKTLQLQLEMMSRWNEEEEKQHHRGR